MCVRVFICIFIYMRACVCEREREYISICVYVREREYIYMCVYEKERKEDSIENKTDKFM